MRPGLWLLLGWLGAVGCIRAAPGCDLETPYELAIGDWTAKANLYDFADERAQFAATLESMVFRQQRVRERARILGWPADVIESELKKEVSDCGCETSFVLGAYTDRPRENNLNEVTSIWRIALETPDGELLPLKVELLGKPDENLIQLYPYLDAFSRVYRVHFPRAERGPVVLRVASAVGKADLPFERL